MSKSSYHGDFEAGGEVVAEAVGAWAAGVSRLTRQPPSSADLEYLEAQIRDVLVLTSQFHGEPIEVTGAITSEPGPIPERDQLKEMIHKTQEAYASLLQKEGLNSQVLTLLQSWIGASISSNAIGLLLEKKKMERDPSTVIEEIRARTAALQQRRTGINRRIAEYRARAGHLDTSEMLSAAELAERMSLGEESVRSRERQRAMFAILPHGRERGKVYPAFQIWEGIQGAPLKQVLKALGELGGTEAYGFFTSPNELLGMQTPIEVLIGRPTTSRESAKGAALLKRSPDERLKTVVDVARLYVEQY
jgi:hypothetical protein